VPPCEIEYLERGHAVHFRCHHPDADGMRIDVMSVMRGVEPFDRLWDRRTTIETLDGDVVDLLSLTDLVQAKKTQRDKDWPMLRRLVDVHYLSNREHGSNEAVDFWLRELRSAELLIEAAALHPARAQAIGVHRIALACAVAGDTDGVEAALAEEERLERTADRRYWEPRRAELERLRHNRS
jgi:hypothetical protein